MAHGGFSNYKAFTPMPDTLTPYERWQMERYGNALPPGSGLGCADHNPYLEYEQNRIDQPEKYEYES